MFAEGAMSQNVTTLLWTQGLEGCIRDGSGEL